jgi:hypothetical protein
MFSFKEPVPNRPTESKSLVKYHTNNMLNLNWYASVVIRNKLAGRNNLNTIHF